MGTIVSRLVETWRSQRLLGRVGIVLLVIVAIEVLGTIIYSFLLPVTG
jgi:hypothetical protein